MTKKEKLISGLIKKNYANVQNAEVMNISFRTTGNYVSKIYDRLGVKDRESACGNVKRTTFHFQ